MTAMHLSPAGRAMKPPPPAKQCEHCGADYTMGSEGRARYAQRRYCSTACVHDAGIKPTLTTRRTFTADTAPAWQHNAACRGEPDPEIFFPATRSEEDRQRATEALTICRRCPVQRDCLAWAIAADADGIWGGTTTTQRNTARTT